MLATKALGIDVPQTDTEQTFQSNTQREMSFMINQQIVVI
jgi:hypothetical protein